MDVLLLLLLLPVFAGGQESGECPDGWILFQDSCYGFGSESITWGGASSLCRIFDSVLAEVDSAEENTFLMNQAKNLSFANMWLGGTDVFSEGYWVWSGSQVAFDYKDWAWGEPNHANGISNEDCLEMYGHKTYHWNDEDCRQNNPFVCESKLL